MPPTNIEVSVVIPCLNEAETLAICINKASDAFAKHDIRGEVVIGDNGSTDGSQEIASASGAVVVDVPSRGYGAALMGGITAARGRYIIMGDADDSYDFSELSKFVDKLKSGADFVIGCRFPSGGGRIMPGAMPFLHRWLGTPILSWLSNLFFRTHIKDINCGMRGFTKAAYDKMELRSPGMEFASEMVMKAALMSISTEQVPITLHPDGRSRAPHLRTWRDGWRHLRFMLLYSPRWMFVIPGMIMFVLGLLGVAGLAAGPIKIGDLVFSTNTHIVSAMVTILGFQTMLLGVFAKAFAVFRGLLPSGRPSDRILQLLKLEQTVAAGVVVLVAGIAMLVWAVAIWGGREFGELDPFSVPRLVIPSVTLIVLGGQMVFSGFLLGLLEIGGATDGER